MEAKALVMAVTTLRGWLVKGVVVAQPLAIIVILLVSQVVPVATAILKFGNIPKKGGSKRGTLLPPNHVVIGG